MIDLPSLNFNFKVVVKKHTNNTPLQKSLQRQRVYVLTVTIIEVPGKMH